MTALVLGSDTVVDVDNTLLGKPVNGEDAVRMLLQLSGRIHRVCTVVSVASRESSASLSQRNQVRSREITDWKHMPTGIPSEARPVATPYRAAARVC